MMSDFAGSWRRCDSFHTGVDRGDHHARIAAVAGPLQRFWRRSRALGIGQR
ncbi:hypothetical protein L838_5399 [Mycobacterium avium MAV_120709_2344]|nr:hypothetical protein L838_5399 [Mycobacterium avium MAV_120709_2344]